MKAKQSKTKAPRSLEKISSGISGLDEITGGGLPKGRPTLVCGNAGCGKTLMSMEFLVRGAQNVDSTTQRYVCVGATVRTRLFNHRCAQIFTDWECRPDPEE